MWVNYGIGLLPSNFLRSHGLGVSVLSDLYYTLREGFFLKKIIVIIANTAQRKAPSSCHLASHIAHRQ